ncbi:MAG: hypothetical protein RR346_02405 [Bacteroidales bacterium]
MKKNFYQTVAIATLSVAFTACEKTNEPDAPVIPYNDGAYILNSGASSVANSSSLSYYDFLSQNISNGVFKAQNDEDPLGDWANHMCIYGSKMYIALSNSGKIEVTDLNGKRLKKIELKNEQNQPLKPRYIVSHGAYVYFTSYGGTVQRIDTLNMNLDSRKIQVGDFPEALTVAGNKLFVNNSKYMSNNVNDHGNTVSVIDLTSFSKIKDIDVATNPYNQALTAADGNVYIVSQENWNGPHTLQRINPENYEVTRIGDASIIANNGNTLYTYLAIYNGETWFKTYDLKTNTYSDKQFIDVSKFSFINAMNVNPANGDLYICDTPSKVKGVVYVLNNKGEEENSFEVGYSPAGSFFPTKKFAVK